MTLKSSVKVSDREKMSVLYSLQRRNRLYSLSGPVQHLDSHRSQDKRHAPSLHTSIDTKNVSRCSKSLRTHHNGMHWQQRSEVTHTRVGSFFACVISTYRFTKIVLLPILRSITFCRSATLYRITKIVLLPILRSITTCRSATLEAEVVACAHSTNAAGVGACAPMTLSSFLLQPSTPTVAPDCYCNTKVNSDPFLLPIRTAFEYIITAAYAADFIAKFALER